jgi:hypothetical protein
MSVLFPFLLLLLSSLTLSALAQATCSAAMAPYILPSLNTTQKLAISSPPQGAEVFDTTQGALNVYSGTTWQMLNPSFPDGLAISSTTAALVPPTMNTTQKTAIANPPEGGVVFDTTQDFLNVYSGTTWQSLGPPMVYIGTYTLGSSISMSDNGQVAVFSETVTSPSYGVSWRIWLTYMISFIPSGTSTLSGYAAISSSSTSYFALSTIGTGSVWDSGMTGSGYSPTTVSPDEEITVYLYFYANTAGTVQTYYPTSNAPTTMQLIWASC